MEPFFILPKVTTFLQHNLTNKVYGKSQNGYTHLYMLLLNIYIP
ncbi:hypothetical protein Ga0123461_1737 [Mariprofundus aestuarium]|uniref:Uncharacterized protein n=1 Tax=Mariprofundus aestuarium TaxID=1921086 RepID=A0A2K8KYQ9_MARES|nr:hypothetical protein Ga0123461_1737 [Mariprofundus aestuarium]